MGRVIVRVASWVLFGFLGGVIAAKKGYSPVLGIALAMICGPCGLVIALVLPRTAEGRAMQSEESQWNVELAAARRQKICPQCGGSHSAVNRFCPSCMYRYPDESFPEPK